MIVRFFITPAFSLQGIFLPQGEFYVQIHQPVFRYRRLGIGIAGPANGERVILRN